MESIEQNTMDNSLRSVFVGNIPYDVTEEKLREIFSEVGTIVSFKLMYDRETGKPKGYGFCEYRDQETASCAMRNLNGYEINGRTIRVDSACTEKSRMEMQSLMQTQVIEHPHGPPCDPERAPEIISQMVASMSPEALFDLVKQMKISIQNNPDESKAMLTSNPQLTYAILQALVVLKLIDVDSACAMLYKKNAVPPVLQPIDPMQQMVRQMIPPSPLITGSQNLSTPIHLLPQIHPIQPVSKPEFQFPTDIRNQRPVDQDLRITRDVNLVTQSTVLSMANIITPPPPIPATIPQPPSSSLTQNDMLNKEQKNQDPRTRAVPERPVNGGTIATPTIPVPKPPVIKQEQDSPLLTPEAPSTSSISAPSTDEEKAALIMQVLQLTDEQITMLPVDQRKSIMALREQIAKSTNFNNS